MMEVSILKQKGIKKFKGTGKDDPCLKVKEDLLDEVTIAAINEGRELMKDKGASGYKEMTELKEALDI